MTTKERDDPRITLRKSMLSDTSSLTRGIQSTTEEIESKPRTDFDSSVVLSTITPTLWLVPAPTSAHTKGCKYPRHHVEPYHCQQPPKASQEPRQRLVRGMLLLKHLL